MSSSASRDVKPVPPDLVACGHGREPVLILGRAFCPACLAEGTRANADRMSSSVLRQLDEKRQARRRATHVPARMRSASFDNFETTDEVAARARNVLRQFCVEFEMRRSGRTGFLFAGPSGTGKTHLACAMALQLADRWSTRYVDAPDLSIMIRSTWSNDDEMNVGDIVDTFLRPDFLVIDSLDLFGRTAAEQQVLYDIVARRADTGSRPTVAISALPEDQLMGVINPAILPRIRGSCLPVSFDWPAYRPRRSNPPRMASQEQSQ